MTTTSTNSGFEFSLPTVIAFSPGGTKLPVTGPGRSQSARASPPAAFDYSGFEENCAQAKGEEEGSVVGHPGRDM